MSTEDLMNQASVDIDSEVVETVVGADTKFKGSVKTGKTLRIDGEFEGDIDSTTLVIISEVGKFKGTIKCHTLSLDGYGEGEVSCTELMKLGDNGTFKGDIITKSIFVTSPEALIDGTIKMTPMRK